MVNQTSSTNLVLSQKRKESHSRAVAGAGKPLLCGGEQRLIIGTGVRL
jgi:hypothetical protein